MSGCLLRCRLPVRATLDRRLAALRPWAEDLLSPASQSDDFFDKAVVRARLTEHLSGRRNWPHAL
jgi:hypothetical protein